MTLNHEIDSSGHEGGTLRWLATFPNKPHPQSPDLLTRVTHSGSFLVIMALCKEQQHEDFGASVGGVG